MLYINVFLYRYVFVMWLMQSMELDRWAATPGNVHLDICAQRRFRSARTFAQSDQNLRWRILDSQGCKNLFRHADNEDWCPRICRLIWIFAGCTCPEVRFLTLRLRYFRTLEMFRRLDANIFRQHIWTMLPSIYSFHVQLSQAVVASLKSRQVWMNVLIRHIFRQPAQNILFITSISFHKMLALR